MKLEVGMYVRTTYGIGKITNAYIVYSDDGCLWHLAYMTDNPKIEIGIYTKEYSWDLFGEIQKDHRIKYEPLNVNTQKYFDMVYNEEIEEPVCYVPIKNGVPRNASLYDNHKFIKASHTLLGNGEEPCLIEVGDYVNGHKVLEVYKDRIKFGEDGLVLARRSNYDNYYLYFEDIKSIVTKEQFSQMEYKVGE